MTTIAILGDTPLTFCHIPKTGGTSIEAWFYNNEYYLEADINNFKILYINDHPRLETIQQTYSATANSPTMAVVRNPWSRAVSAYFYSHKHPRIWIHNKMTEIPPWDTFIANIESYTHFDWYEMTTPQVDWIPNGVDFLLKTENLSNDFKVIQEMYGKPDQPLPWVLQSEHTDYRLYYNDEQKAKVARIFEKDIDTFKYTFDN